MLFCYRFHTLHAFQISNLFSFPDLALINEHKHEAPKVKILEAGTGFFGGGIKSLIFMELEEILSLLLRGVKEGSRR